MKRGSLGLAWWHLVCCLAGMIAPAATGEVGFCLQQARSLPMSAGSWLPASRLMPSRDPVLAAYDWDLSQLAKQEHLSTNYKPCHKEAPIYRYKVLNGSIYVDRDHSNDARYKPYRDGFLEMLVLSIWLYKDFPDIELIVDYTDHPQLCEQAIPFLRFSVFNVTTLKPTAAVYNFTELLSPSWVTASYVSKLLGTVPGGSAVTQSASTAAASQSEALPYTRGFTIPSPEAWRDLSLSPAQLQDFLQCLDTTHPWVSKHPVVFWRGAATGCSRGWPAYSASKKPAATATAPSTIAAPIASATGILPHLLRNKRIQLALRVFPYSTIFDVGITSLPRFTSECLGVPALHEHRALLAEEQDCGTPEHWQLAHRAPGNQPGRRQDVLHTMPQQQQQPQNHTGVGNGDLGQPLPQAGPDHDQPESERRTLAEQQQSDVSSRRRGNVHMVARAYRAVGYLLHRGEALGMEGWADAAITLSVDGYGPAYRLPQQLLLGSAVLKMQSPYATWIDWNLVPGVHYAEFAYDLSDVEEQGVKMVSALLNTKEVSDKGPAAVKVTEPMQQAVPGVTGQHPKSLAAAARQLLVARVSIMAQLDAFAWSVARYKEVCPWQVEPVLDDEMWRLLQLDPAEIFASKGVLESVHLDVMSSMRGNFDVALKHPAYAGQLKAENAGGR